MPSKYGGRRTEVDAASQLNISELGICMPRQFTLAAAVLAAKLLNWPEEPLPTKD
jgi:hypothetical protein